MLRRIGNKKRIASEIIKHFPKDITVFIDLCFGAGSMTWAMMKRFPDLYFFANDLDGDVANLWFVMQNENDFNKLHEAVELCPYNRTIFDYFKRNEAKNNIEKALRFLYLSNYSYLGKNDILSFSAYSNSKKILLSDMKDIFIFLKAVRFEHADLFNVKLPISYRKNRPLQKYGQFAYLDLPYINTTDNYSNSFTEDDTRKAIEKMNKTGLRYAISEFKSEITKQIAKDFNLNYIEIKERIILSKKRDTEILMTNYKPVCQDSKQLKLFQTI